MLAQAGQEIEKDGEREQVRNGMCSNAHGKDVFETRCKQLKWRVRGGYKRRVPLCNCQ